MQRGVWGILMAQMPRVNAVDSMLDDGEKGGALEGATQFRPTLSDFSRGPLACQTSSL
jgi:hypothetical protein